MPQITQKQLDQLKKLQEHIFMDLNFDDARELKFLIEDIEREGEGC